MISGKKQIPGFLGAKKSKSSSLPLFQKKTKPLRFDWNDFCARALRKEPAQELRLLASPPEALPPVDLLAHQRAQKELRCLGSLDDEDDS